MKIKTDGDNLCKFSHQHPKLKIYSKAFEEEALKRLKKQLLEKHKETWEEGIKKKGPDFSAFKSGFERIEKMAKEVGEDAHGRDDKVGFLFFGLFARFFQARPSHFKISLRSCLPERTSTLPPTST